MSYTTPLTDQSPTYRQALVQATDLAIEYCRMGWRASRTFHQMAIYAAGGEESPAVRRICQLTGVTRQDSASCLSIAGEKEVGRIWKEWMLAPWTGTPEQAELIKRMVDDAWNSLYPEPEAERQRR